MVKKLETIRTVQQTSKHIIFEKVLKNFSVNNRTYRYGIAQVQRCTRSQISLLTLE